MIGVVDSTGKVMSGRFISQSRHTDLPDLVAAFQSRGRRAHRLNRRQKQAREYPDNRHYDQQFNQRESISDVAFLNHKLAFIV